ncbi:MAG: hypothetical protein RIG84_05070 [Roseovarius sp.]
MTIPGRIDRATIAELDRRIAFHADDQIMEADFSGFTFADTLSVNAFYDRLEERIAETGEEKWFFLVNLNGTRIEPEAWAAYSRRGRALNLAHSMGSVRFDASEETRAQIMRAANTEAFDPNLFSDREAALARLRSLPSQRRAASSAPASTYSREEIAARVTFDESKRIMEVDLSHFTLHNSRDVDTLFDYLEDRIKASDKRWFFLVNLNDCEILPAAWVRYAYRGKALNEAASIGTVRFAVGAGTAEEIRLRAETQSFHPNIRDTREEALALIEEMLARKLQEK